MLLRFRSGSITPAADRETATKRRRRPAAVQPLEALADLCGFIQPEHAVVDEDARQLVAHRSMNDERRDRRIHTAAQRTHDPPAADLRSDLRRRLVDKRGPSSNRPYSHRPHTRSCGGFRGHARCAPLLDETAAHTADVRRPPSRRSGHWRLSPAPRSPEGAWRRKSPWLAQTRMSFGTSANRSAPRSVTGGLAARETHRMSELALRGRRDGAAECVRHQLHAVADAEDGLPTRNQRRIALLARLYQTRSSVRPTNDAHRACARGSSRPAHLAARSRNTRTVPQAPGISVWYCDPKSRREWFDDSRKVGEHRYYNGVARTEH